MKYYRNEVLLQYYRNKNVYVKPNLNLPMFWRSGTLALEFFAWICHTFCLYTIKKCPETSFNKIK